MTDREIVIETQRLRLRPVEMSDLETTHAYASDLENTKFMMFLPYESLEETRQALQKAAGEWRKENAAFWEFAIEAENEHVGGITLYFMEDRSEVELGWVLKKDCWGRGFVTEAALALMEYARRELGVRRVFACCDCENIASRRVMEKLGMRRVVSDGRRTNRSTGDAVHTEWIYEILY